MSSICKPESADPGHGAWTPLAFGTLARVLRNDDLQLEEPSDDETPWPACLVRDSRLYASGPAGFRSTGRDDRNCVPQRTRPDGKCSCRRARGTHGRQTASLHGHSVCFASARLGALETAQSDATLGRRQASNRVRTCVLSAQKQALEYLHRQSNADERGLPDAEHLDSRWST
jgi:hypothetical protein